MSDSVPSSPRLRDEKKIGVFVRIISWGGALKITLTATDMHSESHGGR